MKLGPLKSDTVTLFCLPFRLGIYKISGLRVFNKLSQQEMMTNELPGIVVVDGSSKQVTEEQKPKEVEDLL